MNTFKTKSALPYITDWELINWKAIEQYVFKLQQRIYRAEKLGQKRKVRDLQRMLMNSKASLLSSIRRVTQINKGKRTAGVDGYKALSPNERVKLVNEMVNLDLKKHRPKPAFRTYIKKKNGKLRPLGIPTIKDRVYQNIVKQALEPQWECRFEPSSYGFRPKRNCHDAIERIFNNIKGSGTKQWIFEGDFKGCFDNLNHDYIMKQLENFPNKDIIFKWLKAGFVDDNTFEMTDFGTPQGGIISPLLANIALCGMENTLGIKYDKRDRNTTKYSLCFYADDFVVMCKTKEDAEEVYNLIQPYLDERGLELAKEKTKIIHTSEGFDFLGFNVRRYKTWKGWKTLIKPSKDSIKKLKEKITQARLNLNGSNVEALINKLNPIITGTANYWCSAVSKKTFSKIDNHVWYNGERFIKRLHPKKSRKWINKRYYKPDIHGQSKDKWLLTDPKGKYQIKKMSWTPIIRHTMIKHNHSPFDEELTEYFHKRDIKEFNRFNINLKQKLAKKQKYKCPMCKCSIVDNKEGVEIHHKEPIKDGGDNQLKNLQLLHISCHIRHHIKDQ